MGNWRSNIMRCMAVRACPTNSLCPRNASSMNPYLSFSIAMCAVVLIALAGTAYLAAYFNRRSKNDMAAALQPLADVIDGEMDVEDGQISGRYQGQLAEGKVATMPGGMSRIFLTSIVEGAGGQPWEWTLTRSKEPGG